MKYFFVQAISSSLSIGNIFKELNLENKGHWINWDPNAIIFVITTPEN